MSHVDILWFQYPLNQALTIPRFYLLHNYYAERIRTSPWVTLHEQGTVEGHQNEEVPMSRSSKGYHLGRWQPGDLDV